MLQLVHPMRDQSPGGRALLLAGLEQFIGPHRGMDCRILAMAPDHLIGAGPQFPFGNHSREAPIAIKAQIAPTARDTHSPTVIGGASSSGFGKGMEGQFSGHEDT